MHSAACGWVSGSVKTPTKINALVLHNVLLSYQAWHGSMSRLKHTYHIGTASKAKLTTQFAFNQQCCSYYIVVGNRIHNISMICRSNTLIFPQVLDKSFQHKAQAIQPWHSNHSSGGH